MATLFPAGLDQYDPVPRNQNQAVKHHDRHQNVEDAIEAIEAKVGIDGSLDPDSLTYQLDQLLGPGGSSLIGFIQSGAGAVLRPMQDKARDIVSVKDFGASGNGVTDDTLSIQAGIDRVALVGGELYLPAGTYRVTGSLTKTSGLGFSIRGAGEGVTTLVRATDFPGTVLNINQTSDVTVSELTIDCQHSVNPNGNHGIAAFACPNLLIQNVTVTDYKNTAILVYSTGVSGTRNARVRNCTALGLNVANNGILVGDIEESGIESCYVSGVTGSPGYGLQIKNVALRCWIRNSYARDCVAGVAFGNDTGILAVQDSVVSNCATYNCTTGLLTGYAQRNAVTGVWIDMNGIVSNAIDLQNNSIYNVISGVYVRNLDTSRSCVRFRSGCSDNLVEIAALSAATFGGAAAATFDSGVVSNQVVLGQVLSPVSVTSTTSLVSNGSGNPTNTFVYRSIPLKQTVVIASGAIAVRDNKVERVRVDTEGGAATDDLDTITPGIDGQQIRLETVANARDVVVKHGTGNIRLNGGADFTLATVNMSLTLEYKSSISAWAEVARGTAT